jgi:hypothetical protein
MARGEPQGLEIEGSEDNPAYVIRVWHNPNMTEKPDDYDGSDADEDEKGEYGDWHATHVTVVARGDGLKVEEALPTGTEEDDYDYGDDDEETAMKSIDKEFRAQVEQVIKANAEIIERLAKFDVEEKSIDQDETVSVQEIAAEEVSVEEVKSEIAVEAVEAVEEVVAEEITEEVKTEDTIVEEVKTQEELTEVVEEEQPVQESKASITFDDLRQFHDLLKDISNL